MNEGMLRLESGVVIFQEGRTLVIRPKPGMHEVMVQHADLAEIIAWFQQVYRKEYGHKFHAGGTEIPQVQCQNCRWWGVAPEGYEGHVNRKGLRVCGVPSLRRGYGWEVAEISPTKAVVEYDEGWGLLTGPEYGCRLGEESP